MKPLLLGYDASEKPIWLSEDDAACHSLVTGASGGGKSKYLENLCREYLKNGVGFCLADPHGQLYENVLDHCAHRVLERDIILLNLSNPSDAIIGFNPFQRAPEGDISVQVDRRVTATMHAWGVLDTDQTPTLARTLRLVYTIMLEQDLGLPQVRHLIDFNAGEIRGQLIEKISSPLVQREWLELQQLKAKDWRDETLSAKNRLFKFLASDTLCRVMGVPQRSLNLTEIVDQGKVLLVNLAPSDYLSHENARAFGALLVTEFFEHALRRKRDALGRLPRPFHLILDEFANFLCVDVANGLDQLRKFSLFLTLAFQRFRQLDENVMDAVLTNCRIKAVFGGLPAQSAKLMAEELFIGQLDPKKIKVAIYQTKFWPQYSRDKVYTNGTSRSTSSSSSSGGGDTSSSSSFNGTSTSYFYDNWFSMPELGGTRTQSTNRGNTQITGSSSSWSEGTSDSHTDSESVADIPIFVPVPFEELSSLQYFTMEEQLTQLTAALKEQFPRHCFIKIQGQQTQPMLVPFVEPVRSFNTSTENLEWYRQMQLDKFQALPAAEIDRLIAAQETALLNMTSALPAQSPVPPIIEATFSPLPEPKPVLVELRRSQDEPIWNRKPLGDSINPSPVMAEQNPIPRKRGPKADTENHNKVSQLVGGYGADWTTDENLFEICERLDAETVPIPKTWPARSDGKSRSWSRAFTNYPHLVVKAIKDRLKAAQSAAVG